MVALAQAIAVGIGIFLYIRSSLPAAYLAILLIAGFLCGGANLKFLMREVTLPKELGAAADQAMAQGAGRGTGRRREAAHDGRQGWHLRHAAGRGDYSLNAKGNFEFERTVGYREGEMSV